MSPLPLSFLMLEQSIQNVTHALSNRAEFFSSVGWSVGRCGSCGDAGLMYLATVKQCER